MTTKQLIVGLAIIALMVLIATLYVTAELRKEIRVQSVNEVERYEKLAVRLDTIENHLKPAVSHVDNDEITNVEPETVGLEEQALRQLLQTYIKEQQAVRQLLEMRVEPH